MNHENASNTVKMPRITSDSPYLWVSINMVFSFSKVDKQVVATTLWLG
jgi:hypothetical protein